MHVLVALSHLWGVLNTIVLKVFRHIAASALGVMVFVILTQVVFRYLLNDALSWTEELSRFLMLWMVGLMAPIAWRHGGFVSIDMLTRFLPQRLASLLSLLLLVFSAILFAFAAKIGWAEVGGIGGRFAMPALKVPGAFDFSVWIRVPRAAMMASLAVGVTAMLSVSLELMLRQLVVLAGGAERLDPLAPVIGLETE
ncbi:TRAP transporter small permease subunit [Martelella alba]|uniref:TRAP transporter small permease protein n=1 Tax=Martelella alba TaxID=2590451 RepID=A0A506U987_9HYPH|nr:TRAP transporter small permease subunit [Martelella alba]TPW31002.1 TRAP transporter small permease subunit [Martelella alba]